MAFNRTWGIHVALLSLSDSLGLRANISDFMYYHLYKHRLNEGLFLFSHQGCCNLVMCDHYLVTSIP
jgi:hypothetical protein